MKITPIVLRTRFCLPLRAKHQAADALSHISTHGGHNIPLEDLIPCLALYGPEEDGYLVGEYVGGGNAFGQFLGRPMLMAMAKE